MATVGPHSDFERALWSALEPRLEDHIRLDLNDPEECQQFSDMISDLARALVEAGGGPDHIVIVGDDGGWTMQHPLNERFAGPDSPLFGCIYNFGIEFMMSMGEKREPGRYRLWNEWKPGIFSESEVLTWNWERIDG